MNKESYIREINDLLQDADLNTLDLCMKILNSLKGDCDG